MREKKVIWERSERPDRIDRMEENTNIFSSIYDTSSFTNENLADGQPAIHNNTVIVKKDGMLKQLVIDSDNNIILEEI